METDLSRRQYRSDRIVFLGDWHVPFHDRRVTKLVLSFLKDYKPTHIYLIGDFLDFYSLSRFDKDPERITSLGHEIEEATELLNRIRKTTPRAKIHYQDGNHEDRLNIWKKKHPELSTLPGFSVPELLSLDQVKIQHISYQQSYSHANLSINHGHAVRGKSGASAFAELEKRYGSGISGHTHRLGAVHTTRGGQQFDWYENGCLCDLEPEYCTHPDWQHGFHVGQVISERVFMTPVPIVNYQFIFNGSVYSG